MPFRYANVYIERVKFWQPKIPYDSLQLSINAVLICENLYGLCRVQMRIMTFFQTESHLYKFVITNDCSNKCNHQIEIITKLFRWPLWILLIFFPSNRISFSSRFFVGFISLPHFALCNINTNIYLVTERIRWNLAKAPTMESLTHFPLYDISKSPKVCDSSAIACWTGSWLIFR